MRSIVAVVDEALDLLEVLVFSTSFYIDGPMERRWILDL